MKAVIFGAPGSGKGTYASRLQAKLGLDVIAMGDIFREMMKENSDLGRNIKSYVERGSLVPDDLVNKVLKERLAKVPPDEALFWTVTPAPFNRSKTSTRSSRLTW